MRMKKTTEMKRTRLTNEQKLKIIDEVKTEIIDKRQAMQKYNISRGTIWEMLRNEKNLREIASSFEMKQKKANSYPRDKMLEEALITWLRQTREFGGPITGPIIQQKALNIYDQLEAEAQNREILLHKGKNRKFVASEGWLSGFKKRHGIKKIIAKKDIHSSDTEEDTSSAPEGDTPNDIQEDIQAMLFQEESKRSSMSAENAYQCFNAFSWLETQKEIAISEGDLIVVERLKKLVQEQAIPETCAENNFINL